jgi:integrase
MFASLDVRRSLDARNAALLALLYGAGLRRDEACRADFADLDVESGALRVLGKGNKERITHLPHGARAAVKAWLAHRGMDPGPLLFATEHGRELTRRRMAGQTVAHAIATIGQRAGVPRFSPHDLRRSWIGDLMRAGADVGTIQRLAGHASPETTTRYDRRGDEERAEAAELISVPFVAPEDTPPETDDQTIARGLGYLGVQCQPKEPMP